MSAIDKARHRIDGFQQAHRWLAFPLAVMKKFGDDRAGNLAALIAYYGFFSLFPLLLVLVALLGLVLRNNPELRSDIIGSALAQFPIIGDQIRQNLPALSGQGAGVAVGVGTATALWAGLGVMQATQNAFNDVWDIPMKERPNFIETRLRALIMLALLGTFALGATVLSGVGTWEGSVGAALRVVAFAGSLALNFVAFSVAYRVLTDRNLSWRDVFAGAAFAAVAWGALQAVGSFYVNHQLKQSTQVYGFFGFVLGLLAWIYLGAQIMLLGAEINVVKKRRLWPRGLMPPPLTDTDKRALTQAAKVEERRPEQSVEVSFNPEAAPQGEQAEGNEARSP
ncbi:MAG: YihY/virulence factor BrkB family protein [Actinomycetota bacterium]|nr:YihY/virulence factor BrkB family protein [Actinomycetota bacterium]